jgi:alpha-tubulin suppressor-like RCC1 family protein
MGVGLGVLLFLYAGVTHTVCVLKDGSVVSFGKGANGQLGHGDQTERLSPVAIAGLGINNTEACSAGNAAPI